MAKKYKGFSSETAGRDYHRQWNKDNREKRNAITRKWYKKCKEKVFAHYGKQCACCGIAIFEFLSLDHIDGGGCKHRKSLGGDGRGSRFYRWIVKNNYPEGYQTLCYNCNCARGFFGYCPHKENNDG
jgi:hypothetical protein